MPDVESQIEYPKSDEEIIAEILQTKRKISIKEANEIIGKRGFSDMFDPREEGIGLSIYLLEHGQKQLIISFYPQSQEVYTYVKNDYARKKKPKETTLLYTAAQKLMQETSNENNEVFTYKLMTVFENMKQWATTTGNEIFHWENNDISDVEEGENESEKREKPLKSYYFTHIKPEKNNYETN
jgi:hypothetical protein